MKRFLAFLGAVLAGAVVGHSAAYPAISLSFRTIPDMTNYVVRSTQTNILAIVPGEGSFNYQPGVVIPDYRNSFPASGVIFGGWMRTPLSAFGGGTGMTNFSPTAWQATNANLTALQAYGPTTWQATNPNLTLLQANAPTDFQHTNANLTVLANSTPAATKVWKTDGAAVADWRDDQTGSGTGLPTIATVAALMADATTNTVYYLQGYTTAGDGGQGVVNKKTGVTAKFSLNRSATLLTGGTGYVMTNATYTHTHAPATFTVVQGGTGYTDAAAATVLMASDVVNVIVSATGGVITGLTYVDGSAVARDTTTPFAVIQTGGLAGAVKVATYTVPTLYVTGLATTTVATIPIDLHIVASAGDITAVYPTNQVGVPTSDKTSTLVIAQAAGPGANGICKAATYTPFTRLITGGTYSVQGSMSVTAISAGVVTAAEVNAAGTYTVLPGSSANNWQRDVALTLDAAEATGATYRLYVYGFGGKYFPYSSSPLAYWERPDSSDVPVQWFGATPNAAGDDTGPLQAAVDYGYDYMAHGSTTPTAKRVVLPTGALVVTGTIRAAASSVNKAVTIVGQGMGSSGITTASKNIAIVSVGSGGIVWGVDSPTYGAHLSDFYVSGPTDARTDPLNLDIGVQVRSLNQGSITRVEARNCYAGFDLNDWTTGQGEYSQLWALNCNKGYVVLGHNYVRMDVHANACNIGYQGSISQNDFNMTSETEGHVGLWLTYAGNSTVQAHIELCATNMLVGLDTNYVARPDTVSNVEFKNCNFGRNANPSVKFYGGKNIAFNNCRFQENYNGPLISTSTLTNLSVTGILGQWINTDGYFPLTPFVDDSHGMSRVENIIPDGSCEFGYSKWGSTVVALDMSVTTVTGGRAGTSCLKFMATATATAPTNAVTFSTLALARLSGRKIAWSAWVYVPADVAALAPKMRLYLSDGSQHWHAIEMSSHVASPQTIHEGWNFVFGTPGLTWTPAASGKLCFQFNANNPTVDVVSGMYILIDDIVVQAWPGDLDKVANGYWQEKAVIPSGTFSLVGVDASGDIVEAGPVYQPTNSTLTGLTAVVLPDNQSGYLIQYNGTAWTNTTINPFQATNATLTALPSAVAVDAVTNLQVLGNLTAAGLRVTNNARVVQSLQVGTGTSPSTTMVDIGPAANTTNAVVINGGVQSGASTPALTVSQTNNNSGVGYTTVLINQTNTASATATYPLRIAVDGANKVTIDKVGAVVAGGITGSSVTSSGFVVAGAASGYIWLNRAIAYSPETGGYRFTDGTALWDRLRIYGTPKTTPMGATTSVVLLGLTSTNFTGGEISYTIADIHAGGTGATNGVQVGSGNLKYTAGAFNIGGVINYIVNLTGSTNASVNAGANTFGWTWRALTNYIGSPPGFYLQLTPTNTVVDRATTETCTVTYTVINNATQLITPQ